MSHFLGTTEQMILLAVLRLGDRAYGATILDVLESTAGRAPSSGALSTTLDRLERKGLVVSRYDEGDARRGGRPKRAVSLTEAGRMALDDTREALRRLEADALPDPA